ncbi:uncharacterized protein [Ptychodera flava]|uniref:uncharacterized protein n=1 Tax=Ptychodera flava TaxID=63121 RepID=UPI00396A6967
MICKDLHVLVVCLVGCFVAGSTSSNTPALTRSDGGEYVPSDNQKRWLVFGIHAEELTLVIAKKLNDLFERYYAYLNQNHSIHDQRYSYFQSDRLNYRNINDNKNSNGKYNNDVNNHIDLAKLYFRKLNSDFSNLSEVDLLNLCRVLTDLCNEELVQEHICSTSVEIQRVVSEALVSIEKWIDCDFKDWEETTYIKDTDNLIHVVESLDGNGTKDALLSRLEQGKSKEQVKCLKNATPDALTTLSSFLAKVSTTRKRGSEIGTQNEETVQARLDSAYSLIRTLTSHIESSESKSSSNFDKVNVYFFLCAILIAPLLIHVNLVVVWLLLLVIVDKACSRKETATCIGRKQELQNLSKIFDDVCNNVKVAVVSGNEGMGKTTLVNEYVREHENKYADGVFRISARNENTVYNSLIMISIDKNLGGVDTRDCLRKLQEYLERRSAWLIIVDDVDTSELSDNVNDIINGPWKKMAVGHMIVVTRCSMRQSTEFVKNIGLSNCVEISKIDPQNAAKFFTSVNSADDAGKLANEFEPIPIVLSEANNTVSLYEGKVQTFIQDVRHRKELNKKGIETMSDTRVNLDALMHVQFHAIDSMCTGKKRQELLLARRLLKDFAVMGEASVSFDQISDGMSLIDEYLLLQKNREDVWGQLLKMTLSRNELSIPPHLKESVRGSLSAEEKINSLIDACKILKPCLDQILKTSQDDVIAVGDQKFMGTWQNICAMQ